MINIAYEDYDYDFRFLTHVKKFIRRSEDVKTKCESIPAILFFELLIEPQG